MKRNISNIKNTKYDLLVIGGGIHGATVAYYASHAGLKTCLIEKEDFGSKTSANSLKVLHGGLRYLQHANFKRMRESIYSRKVFQKIAPNLILNLPFVIPTKGFLVKSKLALFIALKFNDIISYDRNKGITKECSIPGGKILSKSELKEIIGELNDEKITGGALWYESIATNTERLLFEFLINSGKIGTDLANYLKAVNYNYTDSKITSVKVQDEITKESFNIDAKIVVNAVGPWLNSILAKTDDFNYLKTPLTKAVNIIVKGNLFGKYAVGLESASEFEDSSAIINKGKRLFFFVPLGNYTMIGTTYQIYSDNPDNCKILEEDIKEILEEVNSVYNGLNLKIEDVAQTHVGLQAMPDIEFKSKFDIQPETHSAVIDHKKYGKLNNLVSIKSVKYTTAPAMAKRVVELSLEKLELKEKNDLKNLFSLKFNKNEFIKNYEDFSKETLSRLWTNYGLHAKNVLEFIKKSNDMKEIIFEKENITKGEIIYCIEEEMATNPNDIIDRRLGLSTLEKIDKSYYQKVENIFNETKQLN